MRFLERFEGTYIFRNHYRFPSLFADMPPQKVLDDSKRVRNFISSKGYPRYCATTAIADGTIMLSGGRSRRGKMRGPPGSRDWSTALKGCNDETFIDFIKRCLDWDVDNRMTPPMALKHTWLRKKMLPLPPDSSSVTPGIMQRSGRSGSIQGTLIDGLSNVSSRGMKLPVI